VDIADSKPERVGEQHRVRDLVAEAIDAACSLAFTLHFGEVAGRAEDLIELDPSAVGRLAKVFDGDCANLDVDVGLRGSSRKPSSSLFFWTR